MRDLKKAFGRPNEEFTFRVHQTLLSIEEREDRKVKRKLSLSMALCAALAVTILIVGAFAAGSLMNGAQDERLPLSGGDGDGREGNGNAAAEYWLDAEGMYYHKNQDCAFPGSEADGAVRVTAEEIAENGYEACPVCVRGREAGVWATDGGRYYHMVSDCSGMKNPIAMTWENAVSLGKAPCPVCVGTGVAATVPQVTPLWPPLTPQPENMEGSAQPTPMPEGVMTVWAARNGR